MHLFKHSSCLLFFISSVYSTIVADTKVTEEDLVGVNRNILPSLLDLVRKDFFRYFKVDLSKECPFWNENGMCNNRQCAVSPAVDAEKDKLDHIWNEQDLGALRHYKKESPFEIKCSQSDMDFCVIEDEHSKSGVYVDLLENPERYTGYSGDSAWRIWKSIYEQNCFKFIYGQSLESWKSRPVDPSNLCVEKRAFYRVISGMHTSISAHLCWDHLNKDTNTWEPNMDCYISRIGEHPDRKENLYFLYTIMLEAVSRLDNYLDIYTYCTGNKDENRSTRNLLQSVIDEVTKRKPYIGTESMFSNDIKLKEEFRSQFKNISRIMDCVGCEKCRMWGKIQVMGIGTALKILFSLDPIVHSREAQISFPAEKFRRAEIVSLFNAFTKFAGSLQIMEKFEDMRSDLKLDRSPDKLQHESNDDISKKIISFFINLSLKDREKLLNYCLGVFVLLLGIRWLLWESRKSKKTTTGTADKKHTGKNKSQ